MSAEPGRPTERRGLRALAVAALVVWGLVVGGLPLLIGPPGGDDAYYHAMYAQQHARCWLGGVVFPRWYPDLNGGLGGPEPRARPALPLALHAAVTLATNDAVATLSLVTLIIPVVAGLVMRTAVRRRGVGELPAVLAGAGWAASPYLLVSLHERAALQECWGLALLPWVLAALLPPRPSHGLQIARGAVAFGVLLATQLLVAYMATVVIGFAHLVSGKRRLSQVLAAGLLGAALAACSWLPNVAALGRVQGNVFTQGWFDWRRRFLFVASPPDPVLDRYMLLAFSGLVVAALVVVFRRGAGRGLAGAGLGVALLATPLSRPLYELVPGFGMLQFPWRWLGVASCLVVLAAASRLPARTGLLALAVCVMPLAAADIFSARLPACPALRPGDPPALVSQVVTRFGVPPLLPSFPAMLPRGTDLGEALRAAPSARQALPQPSATGPKRWAWHVTLTRESPLLLPLLASPGWKTDVDGIERPWRPRNSLIEIVVPVGTHQVSARQVWLLEDVSGWLITFFATFGLAVWRWRRGVEIEP